MPNPTTTTDHVNKGNKLIAEFMGMKCTNYAYGVFTNHKDSNHPHVLYLEDFSNNDSQCNVIKYHSCFDWIMPVVLISLIIKSNILILQKTFTQNTNQKQNEA